jgi:hypothetical protein
MTRKSKTITLVLIGVYGTILLYNYATDGFGNASTQPGSSRSHGFWSWGSSSGSGSNVGGSKSHSSRGGFGSSGRSHSGGARS